MTLHECQMCGATFESDEEPTPGSDPGETYCQNPCEAKYAHPSVSRSALDLLERLSPRPNVWIGTQELSANFRSDGLAMVELIDAGYCERIEPSSEPAWGLTAVGRSYATMRARQRGAVRTINP